MDSQATIEHLPAPSAAAPSRGWPRGAWFFFVTQLLAVVLLQRIAVPGPTIEVILFTFAAGIGALCLFGEVYVSATRFVLFSAFAAAICLSSILAGRDVSPSSIVLLLAAYSTYVIRLSVTREFYLRCINLFVGVMVLMGALTLIQIGGQMLTGKIVVPNMDDLVPKAMIVPGFVYWQTMEWGSDIVKPPAFFFREVSFVSQFLALAVVAEIAFFRRIWRLLILLTALFATFAGTGLIILAVTSPFLLAKLPRVARFLAIPLLAVGVAGLAISGWFTSVEHRLDEYEDQSSSAYGRFIYPIVVLGELQEFDNPVLTGMGAGNGDRTTKGSGVLAAPTKLLLEYGILPAVLFYVFFIYCLFHRAPDFSFAFAQFALHILGGGYLLVSPFIILFFLLGVMFRVQEEPTADQAAGILVRGRPGS
jgi:hypothetical protein